MHTRQYHLIQKKVEDYMTPAFSPSHYVKSESDISLRERPQHEYMLKVWTPSLKFLVSLIKSLSEIFMLI